MADLYATGFLIASNVIVYLLVFVNESAMELMAAFGLNIFFIKGAYWQIFSSMFLHASFMHLCMNMVVLFQFGSILERFMGTFRFFAVYILGGLIANLLSFSYIYYKFLHAQHVNIIGASGAVCVLLGVLASLDKNSAKGLIIALLLMSFAPLLMGINIAWYAHLFGFGAGYLYARFALMGMR